jgi:hypothetical protein
MSDLIGILPSSNDSIAHFAHLGGVLVGYSFVHYFEKNGISKSWGASQRKSQQTADIFSKVKDAFQSVQSNPKPFQTHSRSESYDRDKLHFYRSEVDTLLDKINQVGYLKLSDDERKRLEDASAYLKKFDSH